jgi:hypothetical protein
VYIKQDTYDYIRQLLDLMLVDYSSIEFSNNEIEPGIGETYTVSSYSRTSNVVTINTTADHGAMIGQVVRVKTVDAAVDGYYEVTTTPSTTSLTYNNSGGNISLTSVSPVTVAVTYKELSSYTATLTTFVNHGFSVGDFVTIAGVDDPDSTVEIFNGTFEIGTVPSANSFTYVTSGVTDVASTFVAGTATTTPQLIVPTYGPFPANSDIGIAYSTQDYSGVNVENKLYRGYELRSVGEELDEYSDTIDGFEYRIDCDLDVETNSFTRTLVLIPIDFPDPPATGEVSPPSRFGADRLVFEYPGNISEITIDESADQAATRFFVVGSIPDLGDDASQPYSVASAKDLLAAGWPLLDAEENKSDIADEDTLYKYAQRYLAEHRPPIADISVSVNGSLSPYVGEYSPGDWCSIVADDEFVKMRLASDLEVRDTVIVRKINGFSVSVPNTPTFPEQVRLDLISEPEVDKVGE